MPLFRDNILQTAGYVPGEQPTDTIGIRLGQAGVKRSRSEGVRSRLRAKRESFQNLVHVRGNDQETLADKDNLFSPPQATDRPAPGEGLALDSSGDADGSPRGKSG